MQNYIQPGNVLTVTAPAATTAGDIVVVGGLAGVATSDALINAEVEIQTEGVFRLTKATGFVPAAGDVAYWDVADNALNSDTANVPVGHYTHAALTGDTKARVRLIDVPIGSVSSAEARITVLEEITNLETNAGAGDQVNMTDTNPKVHTEKASIGAAILETDDFLCIDGAVWVDNSDTTPEITVEVLVGTTVIDTLVIATAAANDWAAFSERLKCTTVGGSLVAEITSLGAIKDGTVAAHGGLQKAKAITASSTAGFDITVRCTSDAGHANNLATLRTISAYIQRG